MHLKASLTPSHVTFWGVLLLEGMRARWGGLPYLIGYPQQGLSSATFEAYTVPVKTFFGDEIQLNVFR